MLTIFVPGARLFNPETNEFYITKDQELTLEHSLISLSKWESKWHKPFFSKESKTPEETLDYIRCMTLTRNVDPMVYYNISNNIVEKVNDYIAEPMTATTFKHENQSIKHEIITSEIIYYWMVSFGIPFEECQKWHLNRLITLIQVCSIKNAPSKKMTRSETMRSNSALNAARRKSMHTRG